jgi:hypothetical protein
MIGHVLSLLHGAREGTTPASPIGRSLPFPPQSRQALFPSTRRPASWVVRPIVGENEGARLRAGPLSQVLCPPLRHLLEQLLTADRRNPAGAMALVTKPRAARKPAWHSAAAIANGAHVISALKCLLHLSRI